MSPGTRRTLIYGGAAVAVVVAAGLGVIAERALRAPAAVREVTIPADLAKPPAPPPTTAAKPAPAPHSATATPPPAEPAPAGNAAAVPPKPPGPSFDVVRVEPDGANVVAGRAAPDSKVDLLANGKVAGSATADEAGEFVMTPPPLKPGSHELVLRATDRAGHASLSRRSVVVSVPSKPGEQLLVVAQEPGKPAEILSAGKPPATAAPTATASPAAAPQVAALSPPPPAAGAPAAPPHVDAVETDAGRLFVQGTGTPGARLGIYLNGTHLANPVVGSDGHWSLTVKHGLKPGDYQVRVDELGPGGKVVARAAVPFDYQPGAAASAPKLAAGAPTPAAPAPASPPGTGPSRPPPSTAAVPAPAASAGAGAEAGDVVGTAAPAPAGSPASAAPATAAAPPTNPERAAANPVIEEIGTVKVVRGDSLWRISRTIYGHGIRYTVIYAANQDQIRDPDLIYPDQVFVIPPAEQDRKPASPG